MSSRITFVLFVALIAILAKETCGQDFLMDDLELYTTTQPNDGKIGLKPNVYRFTLGLYKDSNRVKEKDLEIKRFTNESDKLLLSTGILFKSYNISVENVSLGKRFNVQKKKN